MKFTLNPAGLRKVAQDPRLAQLVGRAAGNVAIKAKGNSDVDDEYRASISTPGGVAWKNQHGSGVTGSATLIDGTWVATVESSSPFWHLFEFGSINNPPYRPLTRAVIDAGLKFEER